MSGVTQVGVPVGVTFLLFGDTSKISALPTVISSLEEVAAVEVGEGDGLVEVGQGDAVSVFEV